MMNPNEAIQKAADEVLKAEDRALKQFLVRTVGSVAAGQSLGDMGWKVSCARDVDVKPDGQVTVQFAFRWIEPEEK